MLAMQEQMVREMSAQAALSRQAREAADRLVAEALLRKALARRGMDALRDDITNNRQSPARCESRPGRGVLIRVLMPRAARRAPTHLRRRSS